MMSNKENFNIISALEIALLALFIGFIVMGETVEIKLMGIVGSIITMLSWLLFYFFMISFPGKKEKKVTTASINEEDPLFFVKEYFSPNSGQAKEVGIFIQNIDRDEKDVFPKIRIIGEIQQAEYENGKWKELRPLLLTSNNRNFPNENFEKLEFNYPENIVFAVSGRTKWWSRAEINVCTAG
jgi:hypothetical protein